MQRLIYRRRDIHLDSETRARIELDPELKTPRHDCYRDFIAEHTFATGVRLLRPLVHGSGPAPEGSRKLKSGDARVMLISGKRYILDQGGCKSQY